MAVARSCEPATAAPRMSAKGARPTPVYVIIKAPIEAGLIELGEHTGRCKRKPLGEASASRRLWQG